MLQQQQVASYQMQNGFNDIFSEIINCDITQPPFDDGYTNKWQFLKKRSGWTKIFTSQQGSNDIIDFVKIGDDFYYLYKTGTGTCKLVRCYQSVAGGAYNLEDVMTNLNYDENNNEGIVKLSFPYDADVSDTAINSSASTTEVQVSATSSLDFNTKIGYYIVITSNNYKKDLFFRIDGADSTGKKAYVASPYPIENGDTFTIYKNLGEYIIFKKTGDVNNGKIGICYDIAIDSNKTNTEKQNNFKIFSGLKNSIDMLIFDGYLFKCDKNNIRRQNLNAPFIASNDLGGLFKIYDTEIWSLVNAGDFILVGGKTKLYALVRIAESSGGSFSYALRDLVNQGLFSQNSVLVHGGNLYAVLDNKIWYGISINFTSQSAQVQLKNVGYKIQGYLNRLEKGDKVKGYVYNDLFGFTTYGGNKNNYLFKYNEILQGYMVDEFGKGFNNYQLYNGLYYSQYTNTICINTGTADDGLEIKQKIVIIGPEGYIGYPNRQLLGRLLIGFPGGSTSFTVKLETDGGLYSNNLTLYGDNARRIQEIKYVTNSGTLESQCGSQSLNDMYGDCSLLQNVSSTDGTLGSNLLGTIILGGSTTPGLPMSGITKIFIIGLRIGKVCNYAKYTIENVNNLPLLFGRFDIIYQQADPKLVPVKNVI